MNTKAYNIASELISRIIMLVPFVLLFFAEAAAKFLVNVFFYLWHGASYCVWVGDNPPKNLSKLINKIDRMPTFDNTWSDS